MKKLKLFFRIKDIKNYEESNDKEFEFDKDIQDIVTDIIEVQNVESDTCYNGEECYWIEYTTVDITKEQRELIRERVEELINIQRIYIEEDEVEIYDSIRVR